MSAEAVARLSDDLTGDGRLQTVAAESGLSYDTFRRHFTAQVGQSPSAFRTARRLQTAATLLRLTDMTHREIARTLGFADEFHFSRRFRAQFAVSPRDYRRVCSDQLSQSEELVGCRLRTAGGTGRR